MKNTSVKQILKVIKRRFVLIRYYAVKGWVEERDKHREPSSTAPSQAPEAPVEA